MLGAARDLLRSLYHCHLNSLESYIRPRPANHSTDKLFRRGASKGHDLALCPAFIYVMLIDIVLLYVCRWQCIVVVIQFLVLSLGRSLCSPPVCEAPLGREGQSLVLVDEGECVRRCGPLNVSLAADACRAMRHAAIKTVRIPQISDLRALIEDPKLNLKVKK